MGWVETRHPPTRTADGQTDRSSRHGDLVTCCLLLTQHCWLLIGDSYLHAIYTESGSSQRKHLWLCYYSGNNNDRIIPLTVWIKIWWYDMTTVGTYGVSCSRVSYRCPADNNISVTLPAKCRWWISLFYVWKLKIIIRIPAACAELQALSKYPILHNELFNVILINSTNQLGIVISVLLLLCTQSMPDHHVWINKNKSQRSFPFQKTHSTLWFTCVYTAILNTTQAHYMLTRHFDMMFLKQVQPIFTPSADRLMYRISVC